MQKLWLKNFEHHISGTTWSTADDLVQAGSVKALREVEKHFWVALVEDEEGGPYEVEVMITPHKIKAFTCECWSAGRRLMCAHIAAALLKLRQFLEQKTEENKSKAEKQANAGLQRITVGNILDSATPEALSEFVQEYARRDRDFALALKTWFAGVVPGAENPFALVLDSVIPKNIQDKKMREPDLRRLRQTLDDLNRQLGGALEEHNYPAAFQIAGTILEKIPPLVSKLDDTRRQMLLEQCQSAFSQIEKFQDSQISPELRESAWGFIFDLVPGAHFPPEMHGDVLRFLVKEAAGEEKFGRISGMYDQTPTPVPDVVMFLFAGALARRGAHDAVIRILEEHISQPALLKEALVMLAYIGETESAFRAGEYFLDRVKFSLGQRREIERMLEEIARRDGDGARRIRLLWRQFLRSLDFEYFNEMKAVAGKDWPNELKRRLSELRRQGNDNVTAVVLAAEGEKDELARLLEKQNDLQQFQQYENLFLPEDRSFVRDRYIELLAGYLSQHFGRQASAFVRQQLAGLLQKNEPDTVLEIIRALVGRFSDRPSLPEELAELFPKSKRKAILQA
ncbi:MAG: hypothetical protein R2791_08985 [Saprospiraceae bacterium]